MICNDYIQSILFPVNIIIRSDYIYSNIVYAPSNSKLALPIEIYLNQYQFKRFSDIQS